MKLIDRYILGAFLKNYLISLFVLVGLYVMMDAFFNFDEFSKNADPNAPIWQTLGSVGAYYGAQALFVYGQLAGVIPVVAAAFTLMRMSRFNELTALLAAGVPLLRVAAPVVIAALVINLVIQPLNQEIVIPRLAGWLTLDRDEAAAGASDAFPVRSMPDGRGGIFDAALFYAEPTESIDGHGAVAESVTIIERNEDDRIALVTAARAEYDAHRRAWRLEEGRRVYNLVSVNTPASATAGAGIVVAPEAEVVEFWNAPITPSDIRIHRAADQSVGAGGSYFDLLSTRQINELLNRPGRDASPDLLRAKHTRLAGHVMNLVLMLLAVPAVLTRQPGQLRQAAGRTLLIVGGAMATIFFCQMLARDPPAAGEWAARWPALMAWMPVFIFGPISVVMLDRIET